MSFLTEDCYSCNSFRSGKPSNLFIYFCKTLYMFQTGFPSIIRSSKLHIHRQVFVRPIMLPAASLARLAAGSSNGLTNTVRAVLSSFERLTEINKL